MACSFVHQVLLVVILFISTTLSAGPIVKTTLGELEGAIDGSTNLFVGVPYAQPPVGNLRWKRPQPLQPWSGVRMAVNYANSCMQASPSSLAQSEDCLYLNIYAPQNASNLAVLYWIHGGGWEFGTPIPFVGTNLAEQYNVIVVTVAYRLGALGFLAEPHLLALEPYLGALGIMDQQAGLIWVQNNIAAFGGNPKRVTIFGESAGGGSVGIHLTLPSSKGLFRNAISESGVFFYPTIPDMIPQGLAVSTTVGCANNSDPVACLLSKSASEVMLALPVDGDIILGFRNMSMGVHWYPIIDGKYIVDQPIGLALKGNVFANAVIIGTNGQEGNGFVYPYFNYKQITKEAFEFFVNVSYGNNFLDPVYKTYASDLNAGNYLAALGDMANDFWFQCQRLLLAQGTVKAQIPTYTYLFSYPYTPPGQPNIGATHADEVAFVWEAGIPFNSSEAQLAHWMSSSWAAFASTDTPNSAKLPITWPLRNISNETPMNFNLQLSLLPSAYRASYCGMWLPTLIAGKWPSN